MRIFTQQQIALVSISLLAACSSPKPGTPEFVQTQEQEQQKTAVKNVETGISKTPAWMLNPPQDINSIFTTGEGISPRMQLAIDVAEGMARRDLALRLGGLVSLKIEQIANLTDTAKTIEVRQELDAAIKTAAMEKNVAGYVREKVELAAEGANYRAFVLLRLPIGEANKIAADQIKKNTVLNNKLSASKAFQDLEKEIESARKR